MDRQGLFIDEGIHPLVTCWYLDQWNFSGSDDARCLCKEEGFGFGLGEK